MTKVNNKTFGELNLKERQDLQEWICNDPSVLCAVDINDDLMIIQKEFGQWDNTKERLDLLAIDKQGNLVIIENKLDDTGSNVIWQALKYASYCSSLSKNQIVKIFQEYIDKFPDKDENKNAEERLAEFLEGDLQHINDGYQQRIILVAANFRPEVTSTVLWLQQGYNVRIQCFKATPYQHNEEIFMYFEQILPIKEAESFTIRMAEKTRDNIALQESAQKLGALRQRFWTQLQDAIREKADTDLFTGITPPKDNWISTGVRISGIAIVVVITPRNVRVEIEINTGDKSKNKERFDLLSKHKDQIEANYKGETIHWERMDKNKSSRLRIKKELDGNDEENWPDATEFIIKHLEQIDKVIRPEIERILKSNL